MDLFGWNSTLSDFRAKALDFKKAYDFLVLNSSSFDKDPALKAEKDKLLSSGSLIQASIQKASAAINSVMDMIDSASKFVGLGALPAAVAIAQAGAVAVVTGAITAIAYWMTQFNRLRTKMYDTLIKDGVKPELAIKKLNEIKQESALTSIIKPLMPFAIMAALVYFFKGNKKLF